MKRVREPDVVQANGIQVASLLDLAGSKVKTVQQRASAKDYFDIAAILDAGIGLSEALAAAIAIHGEAFNAAVSVKALTYFEDGDLPSLSETLRNRLRGAALEVNLGQLPLLVGCAGINRGGTEE